MTRHPRITIPRNHYFSVSDHAVKRYKQRIGKKNAARKAIIAHIHRELRRAIAQKKYTCKRDPLRPNHFKHATFECESFVVVTSHSSVITIYSHDEKIEQDPYADFITTRYNDKDKDVSSATD